jgi:predicted NBD/HSP70 family sugar kinase
VTDHDLPGPLRRVGLDAQAMRRGNLALVLGAVVGRESVSQPELVQLTGLKKPTVSRLLDELTRSGWVRAGGAAAGSVGRPRTLFKPDPARGLVVSARISIDSLSALVVDFGGAERARRTESMDVAAADQRDVTAALGRLVAGLLAELGTGNRVLGGALALPGIVSSGTLRYAPGLRWADRDTTALLRAVLPSPPEGAPVVVVGNEARFAAIGEQRYGAAAGVDDFVYLLGESGVGAGVVAGGRLFEGHRGAAGEVGHVTVDLHGRRCSCGKIGCWASYVGQDELVRLVQQARSEAGVPTTELVPTEVLVAARAGDPVASAALLRQRGYLAAGIGNLVSVYDPELVVLGGFLAAAFGDDLAGLRTEVDRWVMGGRVEAELRIETSRVEAATLWGGVSLVHEALVQAPRPRD